MTEPPAFVRALHEARDISDDEPLVAEVELLTAREASAREIKNDDGCSLGMYAVLCWLLDRLETLERRVLEPEHDLERELDRAQARSTS